MKKAFLITLYILFHVFLLKEIRTTIFSIQVNDNLIERVNNSDHLSINDLSARTAYFEYEQPDYQVRFHFGVPFDIFFMIGIVGLMALGADKRYYLSLIFIHAAILLINSVVISIDVITHHWLLMICDLLSQYLIPLCSLGIIPLALLERKRKG